MTEDEAEALEVVAGALVALFVGSPRGLRGFAGAGDLFVMRLSLQ
jgi:hypothetical protein